MRPPESYTEPLKEQQIAAERLTGGVSSYEEDHRMPLELGGAPSDPANLSPEYPRSPNPKDSDETRLKDEVCNGAMTLVRAQGQLVATWLTAYPGYRSQPSAPATRPTTAPSAPAPAAASCSASVSNASPAQNSYETVYVTSSVPDTPGDVAAHYKTTTHDFPTTTDVSGRAQVSFDISRATVGYQVEVDVDLSGRATCSTSFTPV